MSHILSIFWWFSRPIFDWEDGYDGCCPTTLWLVSWTSISWYCYFELVLSTLIVSGCFTWYKDSVVVSGDRWNSGIILVFVPAILTEKFNFDYMYSACKRNCKIFEVQPFSWATCVELCKLRDPALYFISVAYWFIAVQRCWSLSTWTSVIQTLYHLDTYSSFFYEFFLYFSDPYFQIHTSLIEFSFYWRDFIDWFGYVQCICMWNCAVCAWVIDNDELLLYLWWPYIQFITLKVLLCTLFMTLSNYTVCSFISSDHKSAWGIVMILFVSL